MQKDYFKLLMLKVALQPIESCRLVKTCFHMYVSGIVLSMSWTQTRTAECSHSLFMAIYVINSNAFPDVMQNSINYKKNKKTLRTHTCGTKATNNSN